MWVSILLNLKHNDFSWVIQFHFTATQSDRKISSCSCWQIYSIKFRSKSLHHSSWIKHYCTASQTPLKWKMLLLIILSVPGPKNASKADGWPILNGRAVTVCKMDIKQAVRFYVLELGRQRIGNNRGYMRILGFIGLGKNWLYEYCACVTLEVSWSHRSSM